MRWGEMETETNAQFIMSPTYVNGCQQTEAYHTQVTTYSRHSTEFFSRRLPTTSTSGLLQVPSKIIKIVKEVQKTCPSLPQQVQV